MIALAHILLLLLLLMVVTDFNYNEITDNEREKRTFILLIPQDKDVEEEEEGNYGSVRIFYYLYLQTSYLFSSSRHLTPPYLKSFFDPIYLSIRKFRILIPPSAHNT